MQPNTDTTPQILLDLRHHSSKLFKWSESQLKTGQEYLEGLLAAGNLSPKDGKILAKIREHLSQLESLKQ
jgi:hypothetical protein